MRYSLKMLLAAFAIVAAGCAGLIFATTTWAAAFFTAAFLALLGGAVGVIVRRGAARAFWIGFLVVGGTYFVAAYFDGNEPYRPDALQFHEPRLVTTHWLYQLDSYFKPIRARVRAADKSNQAYYKAGGHVYMKIHSDANLVQIGHGLFTLLFGLLGGWLGRYFYSREVVEPRR
jgi:hypothetical protein